MITQSLDVVLSSSGVWVVQFRGGLMLVEVEDDGTCYQLKPQTMERDGILARGGWNLNNGMLFVGPLARPKEYPGTTGSRGRIATTGPSIGGNGATA